MKPTLLTMGYQFEIEGDGKTRQFHVGVVERLGTLPKALHFNELEDGRYSFAIHLSPLHWKHVSEGGFETNVRIAIGQALRDNLFAQQWHDDYDFDPLAPKWDGELSLLE